MILFRNHSVFNKKVKKSCRSRGAKGTGPMGTTRMASPSGGEAETGEAGIGGLQDIRGGNTGRMWGSMTDDGTPPPPPE